MIRKLDLKTILFLALIAFATVFLGQYLLNVFFRDRFMKRLANFIKKWEGSLSRDTKDTASNNPSPCIHNGVTGWHTNKGITWATFKQHAPRFGYKADCETFLNMPDDLWFQILSKVYAGAFPLEKIKHLPSIQAVIITWAWGSGVAGAESRLANFQREVMGIVDSNITPSEIVDNFKKRITPVNEKEWFNKLCDRRLQDFQKMASWEAHGQGWTRRLNDFRATFG